MKKKAILYSLLLCCLAVGGCAALSTFLNGNHQITVTTHEDGTADTTAKN